MSIKKKIRDKFLIKVENLGWRIRNWAFDWRNNFPKMPREKIDEREAFRRHRNR